MGCCYGKRSGDFHIELLSQGANIQVLFCINLKVTQECGVQYGLGVDHARHGNHTEANDAVMSSRERVYEITGQEVSAAPQLVLEVLESPTLRRGAAFEINAAGYANSRRNARDGCTYMGTAESADGAEGHRNDIVVSNNEIGMGATHLVIQYRPSERAYFIKDYGQGTGTFVKIERPVVLKEGFIISYGESHMLVNAIMDDQIQLKYLDGQRADQTL